jgi:small GTP-binding protein
MSGISDDGVETFKAIVIGKSGVGKSTILIRFLEDKFIRTSATIGIDVQTKDVNYHGIKFRLELWDTAGQERYRTIVKNYFSLSKVACVVFDLTDEDSLDEAKSWF